MNDTLNHHVEPASVEELVCHSWDHARQGICQRYQECEDCIRESPMTSVIGAVGVGYLLHRLPVRAILVTQVRVLSALAAPTLLLFGAAKLYDCWQKRTTAKQDCK